MFGSACRDIGFFYVVDHNVPEHVVANAFQSARSFFSLSADGKMKLQ
ncbi:MAG: hypothetical protein HHJ12_18375 [Glaciimonas sp.]|nr:hypothetical protein [Glaciimonas sp.]